MAMFDTVAGRFVNGPYAPKDLSRTPWESNCREFYDCRLRKRRTSVSHFLNLSKARIAILGSGAVLRVESSLPKLLFGNNVQTVCRAGHALDELGALLRDHVDGAISSLAEMDYARTDYCYNFKVGETLPDYVRTLSKIAYLKHRRTTDEYDGAEWWGDNGRMVRAYDKFQEVREKDKLTIPEARGVLRFEVQIRRKSRFLQRRLKNQRPKLRDVLNPFLAYSTLSETLHQMCLDSQFVPLDQARRMLDALYSLRKATRLLGVLRRLESQSVEELKTISPRSTFYADKRELREQGLWPPASGGTELPPLMLPPLEHLLENQEM